MAGAEGPTARVLRVADEYVTGYFEQFPEDAVEAGYPDAPLDRWSDRSAAALVAWEAREDGWLAELEAIDPAAVEGTPAAVPRAYALDRLQSAAGRRICRGHLWHVTPTWNGWIRIFPLVLGEQPVGTEEARAALLARVRDTPRYLETEIANLREGLRRGYSASASSVDAVLTQLDALLTAPPEESPFFDPARRDTTPGFAAALERIVTEQVSPAVARYRDFLRDEYRPAARAETGVAANPDGRECYQASLRYFTSLPLTPEEVHETGLREMERIQGEMREIAGRSFGTADVPALLRRLREDPRYTFRTGDEILAYARAAVERAERAVPAWFGRVPDARVVVRPFPAFQKASGGGFYAAGAPGQPGVYQLGTYAPETVSRAGIEATAFHETWPGHHLQTQIALARSDLHPILRYFFFSGTGEGWALYTERLADEMGLYTSDVDRIGMLSNEALRAARLVVDPGMHAMGWRRGRAIEYLRGHTAEPEATIVSEVDRYIAWPGQATAYLIGSLQIQELRRMARERLGGRFEVREFHDRVLEDGTVTLGMLREKIERWVEKKEAATGSPPARSRS